MIEVKFSKQWRGHCPGTVVELTDERGAELIAQGYCSATAKAETPAPTIDPPANVTAEEDKPKKSYRGRKAEQRPETDAAPSETTP